MLRADGAPNPTQSKAKSSWKGKSDGKKNKVFATNILISFSNAETLGSDVITEIQDCKLSFRCSANKALVLKAQPPVILSNIYSEKYQ